MPGNIIEFLNQRIDNDEKKMRNDKLAIMVLSSYREISHNAALSIPNFILCNGLGLWHCVVCFFGAVLLLGDDVPLNASGQLGLFTNYWSLPIFIGFLLSALGYFVITTIYNFIWWPSFLKGHQYLYYVYNTMLQSSSIWLAVILFIVLALLPDFIGRAYRDIKHHKQLGRHSQDLQLNKTERSGKIVCILAYRFVETSLVPHRRLSSDKLRKFIYPDFPGLKPALDSPYFPPNFYKNRVPAEMKDNIL